MVKKGGKLGGARGQVGGLGLGNSFNFLSAGMFSNQDSQKAKHRGGDWPLYRK